ncbi:hypothetical protein G6F66_015071 [Rhizopus arrhizus]|nr:hypothetical protein G6F32_016512 [Rhizopus arrhizus]KAG1253968.1 hypothetical protein G6F66_015071 [Rhizopus arrhizus]
MHAARGRGRTAGPRRYVARTARRIDRSAAVRRRPAAPVPAVARGADRCVLSRRRAGGWLGRHRHRGAGLL